MWRSTGTITWCGATERADVVGMGRRIRHALEAEGALQLSQVDGRVRFDGGSGSHNFAPLIWITEGRVDVQSLASRASMTGSANACYSITYAIHTPVVFIISAILAFAVAGMASLVFGRASFLVGMVVGMLAAGVGGGIWYGGLILVFRRFLRSALERAA